MSSPLVTINAWVDTTKKKPDTVEGKFWTNRGPLLYNSLGMDGAGWYEHSFIDKGYVLANPQPSVWCDPSPPAPGGLTLDDARYALRRGISGAEDEALLAHVSSPNADGEAFYADRANRLATALARLRAALSAAEKEGT